MQVFCICSLCQLCARRCMKCVAFPHHGLQEGCHFCEGVLQHWATALGILGSCQGSSEIQLEALKLGLPIHAAII